MKKSSKQSFGPQPSQSLPSLPEGRITEELRKLFKVGQSLQATEPASAAAIFFLIKNILNEGGVFEDVEEELLDQAQRAFDSINLNGLTRTAPQEQRESLTEETRVAPLPLTEEDLKSSFKDLQGLQSEKQTIKNAFILPQEYPKLLKRGKGFLMWGMPGTGKTMIAKALTKTLQESIGPEVFMFSLTGAELKGGKVGDTEKNIKLAFETAQKQAEETKKKGAVSIIFLDEIDALAVDRSKSSEPVNVLATNALLQQMDGLKSYPNVLVIGATNRIWGIDSGVARRFGFDLYVDMPGYGARAALLCTELMKRLPDEEIKMVCQLLPKDVEGSCCNKIVHHLNTKDSDDALEEPLRSLVTWLRTLTKSTGMPPRILDELSSETGRSKAYWEKTLQLRDHRLEEMAISPVGYNFSDLDRVVNLILNQLGIEKLKGKLAEQCTFLPSDCEVCENGRCKPCKQCTGPKDQVQLSVEDFKVKGEEKGWSLAEEVAVDLLEENPSSSRLAEYINMMRHKEGETVKGYQMKQRNIKYHTGNMIRQCRLGLI